MRKFITRQRVLILFASAIASLLSLILAYVIGYAGLFGSLLINFSAGAITIGVTVIFVDYLLSEEKKRLNAPARANAQMEIEAIRLQLASVVEILFRGYQDKNHKYRDINSDDFAIHHIQNIERLIAEKKVLEPEFKLHKKDIELYANTLSLAVSSLDRIIGNYGSALSSEEQRMVFAFYPMIKSAESSTAAYRHMLKAAQDSKDKAKLTKIGQELIKTSVRILFPSIRDRFHN